MECIGSGCGRHVLFDVRFEKPGDYISWVLIDVPVLHPLYTSVLYLPIADTC